MLVAGNIAGHHVGRPSLLSMVWFATTKMRCPVTGAASYQHSGQAFMGPAHDKQDPPSDGHKTQQLQLPHPSRRAGPRTAGVCKCTAGSNTRAHHDFSTAQDAPASRLKLHPPQEIHSLFHYLVLIIAVPMIVILLQTIQIGCHG